MAIIDNLRLRALNWLLAGEYDPAWSSETTKRQQLLDYYQGTHKRQLRVKSLQADDNLTVNFSGLVIERTVSMLMGCGVDFEFGAGSETVAEYIEMAWDVNHKAILLHRLAQNGAIYGTCYAKIIPGGNTKGDIPMPRIVALDPRYMLIETNPEDIEQVDRYIMRYNLDDDTARMEITERVAADDNSTLSWTVRNYRNDRNSNGRWSLISDVAWPYIFAPVLHWQNLPEPGDVYGQSDISDVIEIQDRINFVASNISKIIRYHAHPKTWGRGARDKSAVSWGPDELIWLNGDNSMVQNLEMQSDLASSQAYLMVLRQALFDVSRTVDISSMSDKLGALTNFGLRVLYMDATNKNNTKQALYGEAITEINHRMLALAGIQPDDGGEVIWHDALPANEQEQQIMAKADLEMGIASKQTISEHLGYDWEREQERMTEEQATGNNVGAMILQAFNQGM